MFAVSVPMSFTTISVSFTHIYNKVGTYKAVFVATNSNYKAESKVVRELNIEVVD